MGLGPGEVLQRGAIGRGLHDPQVDLQARPQHDRAAGVAFREHRRHIGVRDEALRHARRALRRDQQIEIADGLAPPPQATRDADLEGVRPRAQVVDQRRRVRVGLVQPHPGRSRDLLATALEDPLLERLPDPAESVQLPLARRLFERGNRRDLELVEEQLRPLRTDAADAHDLDEPAGHTLPQLLKELEVPRSHDLHDLRGEVLPYAGEIGERVGSASGELRDRRAVRLDRPRGAAIGAYAERVLVQDLEEIGDLLEDVRDVRVLHHASINLRRSQASHGGSWRTPRSARGREAPPR